MRPRSVRETVMPVLGVLLVGSPGPIIGELSHQFLPGLVVGLAVAAAAGVWQLRAARISAARLAAVEARQARANSIEGARDRAEQDMNLKQYQKT